MLTKYVQSEHLVAVLRMLLNLPKFASDAIFQQDELILSALGRVTCFQRVKRPGILKTSL